VTVRLVALDLDGTIVRRDRTVSARTRRALRRCDAAGVRVVVVTARRWLAAAPLLADLELGGIAIVAGGGAVRDVATGRVLVSSALIPSTVTTAVQRIGAVGLQPLVAVDHGERHIAGDRRLDGPGAARYLARGVAMRGAVDLAGSVPVTRVLAMGPASRIHAAAAACQGLPCHLLVQDCIFPFHAGGQRALELHVAAATKGTALRDLCHQLGVALGEVLAIGDAPSDLAMFEVAGHAVLMGQAEPGLRRRGVVVAPGVDDDGAAWAIESMVLKGRRLTRRSNDAA
jgi:hydroxymethylpyrimidine pyrophosphatase-like HAD family hydrolase